jgi:acetyl-CoA C-acetyltransferase
MERMTNLDVTEATAALATAADAIHESPAGITFPAAYALLARAYFHEYGGSRESLAHVAVKNHANALENDHAHLREAITVEDVLDAPTVASPLELYDACPITDGASALVLVSETYADERGLDATVAVSGTGHATDTLALQERASLTRTPATAEAAEAAYGEADVTPGNVDIVEVHDCFTIAEVLALESLGFYDPGEAIDAARRGETTSDGDLPVNLSGGLKAKGHPVGATGVSQVVEATTILNGDHPNADAIPDARTAVTHNAGGTVASAVVHVLKVMA